MSIDIVSKNIDTGEKRERLILMDDYGADFHVYIPVTATAAERATSLQNAITLMQSNQDAMEAYATANGHDLSAQKAAGIAKKQAAMTVPASPSTT
jgi:hypothetical protein